MAKKKIQRDPRAPKRNMSAYLLYQNAMRNRFKALNPGMTFGQLAKYTSAMYAEMSPAEKESWVARAEADKQRYLHELSSYVPAPGYDAKGDKIVTYDPNVAYPIIKPSGKRSRKIAKDINAPKRNISAYLLYQNAMRNQFKQENPGMTFGQLAKYTSCMYKNFTPEEKSTWVQRAEADKKRYDQQIVAYVPPPGHDARGNVIEDQRPKRRGKRNRKDPDAPKRASGAYVFFTNKMRPIIMKEFPGIKFVDMGRILGERWRALTPEEKVQYENIAADDKKRFQVEMQQYTANQVVAAQVQQREQMQQQQQTMANHQQHLQQHGVNPPAPGIHGGQNHYIDPHQYQYPECNPHSYN